jgi:hypothetical protein
MKLEQLTLQQLKDIMRCIKQELLKKKRGRRRFSKYFNTWEEFINPLSRYWINSRAFSYQWQENFNGEIKKEIREIEEIISYLLNVKHLDAQEGYNQMLDAFIGNNVGIFVWQLDVWGRRNDASKKKTYDIFFKPFVDRGAKVNIDFVYETLNKIKRNPVEDSHETISDLAVLLKIFVEEKQLSIENVQDIINTYNIDGWHKLPSLSKEVEDDTELDYDEVIESGNDDTKLDYDEVIESSLTGIKVYLTILKYYIEDISEPVYWWSREHELYTKGRY